MTKEYEIALERFKTDCAVLRSAKAQYRARQIDDTYFLAARKTFAAFQAILDRAEAREIRNSETN